MSHTPELAELCAEYEALKAKSPELTCMLEKAFAAGRELARADRTGQRGACR